jgi:hypothetical protein
MPVYVLYRDARGKISGGDNGFAPGAFKAGQTRTVSLTGSLMGGLPDRYATGEVFWDVSDTYLNAS